MFAEINKDGWSSVAALEACIGEEKADAPHPIMEAQLLAQKGNETTGSGEVCPPGRQPPAVRIGGLTAPLPPTCTPPQPPAHVRVTSRLAVWQ